MGRRILSILNIKTEGIHQAAYLLGFFAIVSQLLGLVRDRILAGLFGAGVILDTYYASFRIPDVIFALVASSVSVSVLIPFFSKYIDKDEGLEEAKRFAGEIFSVFSFIITIVSVLAFVFMDFFVRLSFPGFTENIIINNIIFLSRIMLLSPILLGFSNLFSTITQLYGKFFVYALSPVLYNIGIIVGALFFYPVFGLSGLAWGVVLGAVLHFAIQVPTVLSLGFKVKPIFNIDYNRIKEVILVSLPRTLALSTQQITILILVSVASLVSVGSISVFNLAYNLQSVPLGIIGASYSSALFPALSRMFGGGEKDKFLENVESSVKHIIFWTIPATILFVVLRAQIVRVAYGAGEFGWDATRLTAALLALFVVSSVAQSLVVMFVRSYYASGNTKKPLFINILSFTSIIILALFLNVIYQKFDFVAYFLEALLKVSNIRGTGVLILPIAYSIGSFINLVLFWQAFQLDFGEFRKDIYKSIFHILSSSVVAGFVTYQFLDVFDEVFNINTLVGIFSQGFFSGILGIIFGIFVLKILGNVELEEIWRALHHKFWKTPVIIPEQGEL
ncbi:MAG: murein biosynthesis integral membrane protein MurJ [Patescibacteria group bacterium]